jgi:hypothetical protein
LNKQRAPVGRGARCILASKFIAKVFMKIDAKIARSVTYSAA